MTNLLPTCNQLEKQLSQSIRTLYKEEINHSPQKITCKLFSRYLAIISDEALTPVEKSLWGSGEQNLSEEIRLEIDSIIKPKLARLIENITTVKIEEILSNALFAINKSCILVIFSEPPQVLKLGILLLMMSLRSLLWKNYNRLILIQTST